MRAVTLINKVLHPQIFAHRMGAQMQVSCNGDPRPILRCQFMHLPIHLQLPPALRGRAWQVCVVEACEHVEQESVAP
jgi:hypothetical protein